MTGLYTLSVFRPSRTHGHDRFPPTSVNTHTHQNVKSRFSLLFLAVGPAIGEVDDERVQSGCNTATAVPSRVATNWINSHMCHRTAARASATQLRFSEIPCSMPHTRFPAEMTATRLDADIERTYVSNGFRSGPTEGFFGSTISMSAANPARI